MYEEPYVEPPENSKEVPVNLHVTWSTTDIQNQAVEKIVRAVYDDMSDDVKKAVFERLEGLVNEMLTEVMEREVQATNMWGEPTSDATSVKKKLEREAEDWLMAKVDNRGHSGSRYNRRTQTRAEYLFKEVIGDSLTKLVKKAIKDSVGDISDMVEAEVKAQLKKLA